MRPLQYGRGAFLCADPRMGICRLSAHGSRGEQEKINLFYSVLF